MSELYVSGKYQSNNPNWHEEDASFKASKIQQLLKPHNLKLNSIAEVGCGSGEILVELQKNLPKDIQFSGYEISPQAYEISKRKSNEQLRFFHEDITKKENIAIDLLLVIDVIEHIEDYFSFMRGIKEKSKYFIFHIPLDMCLWTLFREEMLIESKERVGHIHLFTEKFIKSVLEDIGFKIIESNYTEPLYHNPTGKEKIINLLRKIFFKINKRFATKTIGGYSLLILAERK